MSESMRVDSPVEPLDAPRQEQPAASDLTYFALAATAAPAVPNTPGTGRGPLPEVLAGRYKIERVLGVGGMAAVYLARDLLREQFADPQPYVALKTLSDDFADSPDAHALLYSEYALTTRLNHRHVVRLFNFEVDIPSQHAFISMELLKGLTLDQLLCSHPNGLPWPQLQPIACALLEALAYAHRQGVLHGDLKPSNLILADDGLRLFDFGLGQAAEDQLPGLPRISRERFAAWTPRYAALELLAGEPLSARADVYALGCVLYELASGRHPFNRQTAQQAQSERLDRRLRRPKHLPRHCWPALRHALAFAPTHRDIDCAQLLAHFRQPSSWWRFGA